LGSRVPLISNFDQGRNRLEPFRRETHNLILGGKSIMVTGGNWSEGRLFARGF
jgi:hypothetical protein